MKVEVEGYECRDSLRARITELETEAANLRTVMVAAAEEISAHWDAHCDAEGYGPANLMHRLERGIASHYPGYAAGAFAQLRAKVAELEAECADDEATREMMRDILTRTVNAIRGEPPALTLWDWSDLPERAGAAMASLAGSLEACEQLAAERALNALWDERAAFEAWLISFDGGALLHIEDDGFYEDWPTQRAWAAWQARASLHQAAAPAVQLSAGSQRSALEKIEVKAQAGLCYFTLETAREFLKDIRDEVADALGTERPRR